jgi:hypothetical protein
MSQYMQPSPERLLKQAILLTRAEFDMRSALAVAKQLETHNEDHGALAYGLLTGMVASYCRPFTTSHAYGQLAQKWQQFPGTPHLKAHHVKLLKMRHSLLAHNDLTEHRAAVIWTRGAWHQDKAIVVEARSPIHVPGILEVQELFEHQKERFRDGSQDLVDKLQPVFGWPDAREVDLGLELERLETGQTEEEFYAKRRRKPEVPPRGPSG